MIIYNVSIKVESGIVIEWIKWMKEVHMPELMQTGLFSDCRLCRLLEIDETDGVTFSAQYVCADITDYRAYISEYSDNMRAKMIGLFGGKFVAFRSIMEVL